MHSKTMEKKVRRIGNYLNENYGTNFAGNVWDRKCCLNALTTCGGGNREPTVIKKWQGSELSKQQKRDGLSVESQE